ncbi:MAG: ABC transporter substrate-binding protein [Proteobacteria bacterium]|nr:ABC transporter substrate-binding protein [Pseudomonadota bacterium]
MARRQLLGGAAALAALPAPAIAAPDSARTLRFIPQIDLVFLDPHYSMTNITRNHAGLVFDMLYGTDAAFKAHPQMAEGHTVDNDGKLWRITLRENLWFHDGEPVLARDCVASIKRWGKRDVLGAEVLAVSDEISAPDDRTIQFRLKTSFPMLPEALGKPGAYMPAMLPARLAALDPFTQLPEIIGSGPFRYVANERLQGVRNVYAKFDKYVPRPSGTPDRGTGPKIVHFDRVIWTTMPDQGTALAALQKGEQDWWEYASQDVIPLVRKDKNLRYGVLETEGNFGFVRFNHTQPPFNRPEMRRAILRAVNQEDFCAAVAGEAEFQRPGVGFYPPGLPDATNVGLSTIRPPYTIDQARKALEQAGYRGEKIVQITPGDYPNVKAASEVLADLLQKIGINLDNVTIDWATMTQRVIKKDNPESGGFHLHMLNVPGLSVASPLVNSRLRGVAASESGWYDSKRYEELRFQAITTTDPAERKRLAGELQLECLNTVPQVPTGVTLQPAAWRSDLEGVLLGVPKFWNVKRTA